MIKLRLSTRDELEVFDALDRQIHASRYIISTGLKTHQKYFADPNITYLSIENNRGEFSGYFVLVVEPDTKSVEFRRILIDENKRGLGQVAIKEMGRTIRSGGKFFVIDWTESFAGMGPQPGSVVTVADATALLEANGFVFEHEFPSGNHHYGLAFRKV